jgi:hypothetical protein
MRCAAAALPVNQPCGTIFIQVLVSVITPSYQQGRFIERTLESVWRQNRGTLAGAIEHIVMDGGSTDGTVEILERWGDRISFSTGPDGGQAAAINAGMAMARGGILAYLNSDDVYYDGPSPLPWRRSNGILRRLSSMGTPTTSMARIG